MLEETIGSTPADPSLDDVLALYIEGEESGRAVDRQQLLERYPGFAAELREFFVNRDQMRRLAAPLKSSAAANDHPLGKIRYFGDYELLEEIAAGGMGIVYKARQISLNRIVAVKMILKGTLASEDDVKRFKAEAEAAANLQHPAIVAIHEVGLHEGQHYFSMDYVEGHSLAQLPRERPLSAHQAAEYIRDAAEAVYYAHQQGTLHRDLKPSNILIDRQGRVRITDFGLAKRIGASSDLTLNGQILGTPAYMPPEQASGKRALIAAPSDIYSLGAVLYELLAGRPPFRGESPTETLRQVETLDPVSPRLLNPAVPRDLETICLKCLEKEPHKRYGTAQLLADDFGRYLCGETVLARPPSAIYRFAKFARRNRTGLAVTALVLLFIVLLGGVVGWMVRDQEAVRIAFQQQIANDRAALLAKTVEDIQLSLQEAQTLGDRASTLVNDNPHQWEATLAAALAACRRAEGLAEPNRGTLDPALLNRLSALRDRLQADEQDRQFVARIDAIRMDATEVDLERSEFKGREQSPKVKSLFKTRGIEFGATSPEEVVSWIQMRPKPIQPHILAALDIWLDGRAAETDAERQWLTSVLKVADNDAWRTQARRALSARDNKTLENLVRDVQAAQQPAAFLLLLAIRLPQESESIKLNFLRQIQSAYPSDFWANEHYAMALSAAHPPQWTDAVRFHTAALALRPENPGVYLNFGSALGKTEDHDGAMAAYRRAVEITPNYAEAWIGIGTALVAKGDLGDAIANLREAIRLDSKSAFAHQSLGAALRAKGDLDGAIVEYREAIRLGPRNASPHIGLGNALQAKGNLEGAIAEFHEAISIDPNNAAGSRNNLGAALQAKGDQEAAVAEFREAIQLDPKMAHPHSGLGEALRAKGDLDGAIAEFQHAIRLDPKFAGPYNNLGNALQVKGDLDGATVAYREAIRLDPKFAATHDNLGRLLQTKGDFDGAITEYREAIRLDPKSAQALNNLAHVLKARGDLDGATAAYREAIRLDPKFAATHYNLGRLLQTKGDLDGALAEYREAIRLDPKFADAHNNSGNMLRSKGDLAGAIIEYREASRLDPNLPQAHNNLGQALRVKGDLNGAVAEYRQAIRLDAKNSQAHYDLANALQAKGDLEGAIEEFRESIQLNATYAQAHNNLAVALLAKGDPASAIVEYREAIRLDPILPQPHIGLGNMHQANGDLDGAIAEYGEALRLNPRLARIHVNLGSALHKKGDREAAIEAYRKALEVAPGFAEAEAALNSILNEKSGSDDMSAP